MAIQAKQKHKNPRQFFISAEPAKAVTEESIFRGKKGVLFTFALDCAKVKAQAPERKERRCFIKTKIIKVNLAVINFYFNRYALITM